MDKLMLTEPNVYFKRLYELHVSTKDTSGGDKVQMLKLTWTKI